MAASQILFFFPLTAFLSCTEHSMNNNATSHNTKEERHTTADEEAYLNEPVKSFAFDDHELNIEFSRERNLFDQKMFTSVSSNAVNAHVLILVASPPPITTITSYNWDWRTNLW